MKNLQVSRRKEIIKVRAEIDEKETKETIAQINKLKADSLRKKNRQSISQTHQEKKGGEVKMEKSQWTTQKYK